MSDEEFDRDPEMPSSGEITPVPLPQSEIVAKKRRRRLVLIFGLVLVLLTAMGVAASRIHTIRWRAQVVELKLRGGVSDLSWLQLFEMLRQQNGFGLEGLLDGEGVGEAVQNPFVAGRDLAAGSALFRSRCSSCHGYDGSGGTGPSLKTAPRPGGDEDIALFRVVSRGIPNTAMRASGFADQEIWQTVAFIQSLRKANGTVQSVARVTPVSDAMLLSASDMPADWMMYSGSYNGQRYSRLDQIDRTTVASLRLKWLYQFDSGKEPVETTPIVVGSVMYVTEPPNNVLALDAASGTLLWAYRYPLPEKYTVETYRTNRGVAVYGEQVFMGTLDTHLVAIDASTGQRAWDTEVAKAGDGYSITSAPLVVNGKIIVGVSGGNYGVRGFLAAYDAKTGGMIWRFYTIPEPDEPGHDTWSGESWRTGGGPTWLTGSFDPQSNLVYWGVGNPAPSFNGEARRGDNLYTDSVIALDADSGRLRWHFQFTPHDERDWDSNQIPVLADLRVDNVPRKVMLWANRNGFYYVLDRETGKFLHGSPFVKVTWAKGLSQEGRPVIDESNLPTEDGTLTSPAVVGGTNWWSPSYNPSIGLFYVAAIEQSGVYFKWKQQERNRGNVFVEGDIKQLSESQAFLRALKPESGKLAWEYRFGPDSYSTMSGVLSTAGGVIFAAGGGKADVFVALDAATGGELWKTRLGGRIHAGPITFAQNGRQLVTIAAGRNLLTFESSAAADKAKSR